MVSTEDILNNEISYQDHAQSKNLKKISIAEFLNNIRNEKYGFKIQEMRNQLKGNNPDEYARLKKKLPAVTFSGLFNTNRKMNLIIQYNSLCVFDIDHISDNDINKLLLQFKDDPYIFSFWRSPSGKGIKGLILFNFKTDVDLANCRHHHKYAFSLLQIYFKETYNVEIDNSGCDITRLCFISADNNLIIKGGTEKFEVNTDDVVVPIKNTLKNSRYKASSPSFIEKEHLFSLGRNHAEHRYRIQRITLFLKKRNLSITNSYERWYKIAYIISNTFTYDLGKKYYLRLCRLDDTSHDEEKSIGMLQYCYMNSKKELLFGTIEHYFKETKEEWGRRTDRGYTLCVP
jgi:hypothetical protein